MSYRQPTVIFGVVFPSPPVANTDVGIRLRSSKNERRAAANLECLFLFIIVLFMFIIFSEGEAESGRKPEPGLPSIFTLTSASYATSYSLYAL